MLQPNCTRLIATGRIYTNKFLQLTRPFKAQCLDNEGAIYLVFLYYPAIIELSCRYFKLVVLAWFPPGEMADMMVIAFCWFGANAKSRVPWMWPHVPYLDDLVGQECWNLWKGMEFVGFNLWYSVFIGLLMGVSLSRTIYVLYFVWFCWIDKLLCYQCALCRSAIWVVSSPSLVHLKLYFNCCSVGYVG